MLRWWEGVAGCDAAAVWVGARPLSVSRGDRECNVAGRAWMPGVGV